MKLSSKSSKKLDNVVPPRSPGEALTPATAHAVWEPSYGNVTYLVAVYWRQEDAERKCAECNASEPPPDFPCFTEEVEIRSLYEGQ